MKKERSWRKRVLLACGAVFLLSGALLARDLLRYAREDRANRSLAQEVREAREAARPAPAQDGAAAAPEASKYAESGRLAQYDALWQENSDLTGWLAIEGTAVDYPVMYTPEDPEYYLHRGFDREYAASGCLFVGPGSDPDSNHVIIYGHHMKDGSMFGSLPRYRDPDYAGEHPVIRFDSLTEERSYEVLGAFYARVYGGEERDVFRYYRYTDLAEEDDFNAYVRQVKAASRCDTGVDAVFGDALLTLSTCSYHTEDGRFVVVAKRIS